MESICHKFFGGLGKVGNPRVPLVAWDNILKAKMSGGLELTSFGEQAKALKYQSIHKLLKMHDTKWVFIARELIRKGVNQGKWTKEYKTWSTPKFLLLSPRGNSFQAP